MKIIHCAGCGKKCAEIKAGSQLLKDSVMLCRKCDVKRIASDMRHSSTGDIFNDMFEFGGKR